MAIPVELIKDFAASKCPQLARWGESLAATCQSRTAGSNHAELWHKWMTVLDRLPPPESGSLDASGDTIVIANHNHAVVDSQADEIRETVLELSPWRIGPWHFFEVDLQAEWNSFRKWNRIKDAGWFDGARVLDVGCNNGYFGWKVIDAGAQSVVGCDPFLLYNVQHEMFRRYSADKSRHHILPIADHEIPSGLAAFDIAMSLGALIHRRSPIDHLMLLHSSLRKRGQLVLETMAIDSGDCNLIVPENRYLKMRGVWFVPTIGMLKRWLKRTGFEEIRIVDVSPSKPAEQHRTEFMTFESLSDFLDPTDPTLTIEGYPAPMRVAITAVKRLF